MSMKMFEDGTQLITANLSEGCDPATKSYPSWDKLMADWATIIRENDLYPEEMPWECFDVHPLGCYNFY